jgi:hypothetical protein
MDVDDLTVTDPTPVILALETCRIDPGLQDKSRVFHAFAGQFRPANRPKIENAQMF